MFIHQAACVNEDKENITIGIIVDEPSDINDRNDLVLLRDNLILYIVFIIWLVCVLLFLAVNLLPDEIFHTHAVVRMNKVLKFSSCILQKIIEITASQHLHQRVIREKYLFILRVGFIDQEGTGNS